MSRQMDQPLKTILTLALPMAGTQLITMASGFLCMTMLAHLGNDVLAASALIFSTQMSVMVIAMSVLFSLCILIAHAYGDQDYDKIGLLVQQGWTMALMISIPVMFFLWHIGDILVYFGQLRKLADIVQTYFYAHTWRVLPVMLAVANQQLCYGIQKQRIDITANIIGVGVLLITANILIFGKFGFPALGVRGFAYAVTAQSLFYLIFTTICFIRIADFKRFHLFRYRLHRHWHSIVEMMKFSWPITLQISGEMLSFFVCAAMMGWLGVHALAAYQVVTQYQFLLLVPIFALSQATGVLVGQVYGAKELEKIKLYGEASLKIAVGISIVTGLIFIMLPALLSSAYIDIHDPDNLGTLALIKILFIIVAIAQLFDAMRNVLTGALRGIFDTRFPMYVGLAAIWLVGIPMGYLFGFIFGWGAEGIMSSILLSMLLGAMILVFRWQRAIVRLQKI